MPPSDKRDDDEYDDDHDAVSLQSHYQASGSLSAPSVVSTVSSSRSIATIFSALEADDVAFFDQTVSILDHGDASFASLKAAYQRVRALWRDISQERDAHLWNSLLSLVKVRGRDWSERWDVVRVELGLDLRDPDLTASSLASEGGQGSHDLTVEEDEEAEEAGAASGEEWTQSQREGSETDNSSQSEDDEDDDSEDYWDQRMRGSAASSLTTLGVEAAQSSSSSGQTISATTPKSSRSRDELAALQARMTHLTRQAGNLALQAGRQSARRTAESRETPKGSAGVEQASPSRRINSEETLKTYQHRREQVIRLLTQRQGRGEESDGDSSSSSLGHASVQQRWKAALPPRSFAHDALAAVTPSRGGLRDVAFRRAEESEEAALQGTVRLAQRHYEERLLATCFGWWCELSERQSERQRKADEIKAQTLLSQTIGLWKYLALDARNLKATSVKADIVRCCLSTWRKWRRRTKSTREKRWKERKEQMRESYTIIKEKRQRREQRSFTEQWRSKLLEKRSSDFRHGHLLGGAFFLWRLKQDVAKSLGAQERQALAGMKLSLKRKVFDKWQINARLMGLLDQWDDTHAEPRLRRPMDLWKKRTDLSAMVRAYSAHRLQRHGLQTWLMRLAESSLSKRRQAQADRQLCKSTHYLALQQWKLSVDRVHKRHAQAADHWKAVGVKHVYSVFRRWRDEARSQLLSRVCMGRLEENVLLQWRAAFHRKTIVLPRRADTFFLTRSSGALTACFAHWRSLTRSYQEANAQATNLASRRLLRIALTKWQGVRNNHALREERAIATGEWYTLKRTFSLMKADVRSTRLQIFCTKQSACLTSRLLNLWRARATQQSVDRLSVAHIQALTSLRTERQALKHWTQRVIERRSLLLEVGEAHNETILLKALQQWRRARGRVQGLQRLGQSFQDVKSEEILRRNILRWSFKYRKARSLHERADRFGIAKEARIRSQVFVTWYDTWREGNLHGRELEMVVRRQEVAKCRVLDSWVAKTKSFPAIRFDHSRLKRLAFRKWQDGLPGAILRRQAVDLDEQSLVCKAFKHWYQSGKAKRAAKAAVRFGGPSMARLRKHSSRSQSPFVIKHRRSSGNDSRQNSSPPMGGDLEEGDERSEDGASSLRRARSEVMERDWHQLQDSITHRPQSEANYILGRSRSGISTTFTAHKEAPSIVSSQPTKKAAEILSESHNPSLSPRQLLKSNFNRDSGEQKQVRVRSPISTRSSAPSLRQQQRRPDNDSPPLRGEDRGETDTFSLTSQETPEVDYPKGGASDGARRLVGIGGGGASSSLPSLWVAPSQNDRGGDEVRTERAVSPFAKQRSHESTLALVPAPPLPTIASRSSAFARRLHRDENANGTIPALRAASATDGSLDLVANGLQRSGSESGFLEELRKRRRAMMMMMVVDRRT